MAGETERGFDAACVARVRATTAKGGVSHGTGVLIAPDIVLTAHHVVAPAAERVVLDFLQAKPPMRCTAMVIDAALRPDLDWVMLRCVPDGRASPLPHPIAIAPPEQVATLPRATPWATFGFPWFNAAPATADRPESGKYASGHLEGLVTVRYSDERVRELVQLFSVQAAGGVGESVSGYSGAPLVVDGYLVGIISDAERSGLANAIRRSVGDRSTDAIASAGTLYAISLANILPHVPGLVPAADPYWGVPSVENLDLPNDPFRYLASYDTTDARVFFGRDHDTRALYRLVHDASKPRVILLQGTSGVGKSSLLKAGLLPRLRAGSVCECRCTGVGLLQQLVTRLGASPGVSLADALASSACSLVVIDQLEELLIARDAVQQQELTMLFREMAIALSKVADRKFLLAYRQEWGDEMRSELRAMSIEFAEQFVRPLDEGGIIATVRGLASTEARRDKYKLTIDDDLVGDIVRDLIADRASNIAPRLQILLSWMWEASSGMPVRGFTRAKFGDDLALRSDLREYLLDQLRERGKHSAPAAAGLLLDILEFHVSDLVTATTRTHDELEHRYGAARMAEIDQLVAGLHEPSRLLTSVGNRSHRLVHDALAPVIKREMATSVLAGPLARRRLIGVAHDDRSVAVVRDLADLRLIAAGEPAMRSLTIPEARGLLEASLRIDHPEAIAMTRSWSAALDEAVQAKRVSA